MRLGVESVHIGVDGAALWDVVGKLGLAAQVDSSRCSLERGQRHPKKVEQPLLPFRSAILRIQPLKRRLSQESGL